MKKSICLFFLLFPLLLGAQSEETANSASKPKRIYTLAMMGFMPGANENDQGEGNLRGINIIHFVTGYSINPQINVGAGLAWDVYDMHLFSLRLDFRGYVNQNKVQPYYSLQGGYALAADLTDRWNDRIDLKGGLLAQPSVGVRFETQNKADILFDVGYLFQKAARHDEERKRFDDIVYRRFNFRFGLIF